MSRTVLNTARFGLPTAVAAATVAALAPFGAGIAAGLAALVGAGVFAGTLRRRSTLVPAPTRFIGS